MALDLPSLVHPECKEFAVCGELVAADKSLIKWMHDAPLMIAPHQIGTDPGFLVLILGGSSDTHVHIEIRKEEKFRKEKPPKITNTFQDIEAALARIAGHEIKARIWADFWIPTTDLPPIISSARLQVNRGGVTLKQTGGTLTIQGAPISKMSWSTIGKDEFIEVYMEAKKRMTITDTYFAEAFSEIEPAFATFIKGKA